MNISERIMMWRESRGLSKAELARRLGVTSEAVIQWESGANPPSYKHVVALAETFRVSLERFFGQPPKAKKAS